MVLQYKLKEGSRWIKYPGKDKLEKKTSAYYFRLLSEDKKKILVDKGNYDKVMKRFRQIEFFKHTRRQAGTNLPKQSFKDNLN
ncbi:MAG: hypothetical protein WC915_06175 [archaeon]|jgi:hypothetical protein